MFSFFKKQKSEPTTEEISTLASSALEEVKGKWIYFNETVHLTSDVSLSQKIALFAQPIQQLFQTRYPLLLLGSSEIFWLTVFTAILESGTHSKENVNAAIAELKSKYVRVQGNYKK